MNRATNDELPRWLQIPIGIVIAIIALFCIFASFAFFTNPSTTKPEVGYIFGALLILLCVWLISISIRLISGKRSKGGLMSPMTLRISSLIFLLLPIAGIFTGFYKEKGILAVIQAIAYLGIFTGLNALAKSRMNNNGEISIDSSDEKNELAGNWQLLPESRGQKEYVEIEICSDGTLTYSIENLEKWQVIKLAYSIQGNRIITNQPSRPHEESTEFRLHDNGILELDFNGEKTLYKRGSKRAPKA